MRGLLIVVIILALMAIGFYFLVRDDISDKPEPVVFCTLDAMQCPDGSYVGRVPPSCEFAACVSNSTSTQEDSDPNDEAMGL